MTENVIVKIFVDAAYHIHRRLGPGLLESVYEVILAYALIRMAFFGLRIGCRFSLAPLRETFPVPVYPGEDLGNVGFRN